MFHARRASGSGGSREAGDPPLSGSPSPRRAPPALEVRAPRGGSRRSSPRIARPEPASGRAVAGHRTGVGSISEPIAKEEAPDISPPSITSRFPDLERHRGGRPRERLRAKVKHVLFRT